MILSGANSYAGGTVVNAGTLIVTNAGALPSGTNLTIGASAIFVFDPKNRRQVLRPWDPPPYSSRSAVMHLYPPRQQANLPRRRP